MIIELPYIHDILRDLQCYVYVDDILSCSLQNRLVHLSVLFYDLDNILNTT